VAERDVPGIGIEQIALLFRGTELELRKTSNYFDPVQEAQEPRVRLGKFLAHRSPALEATYRELEQIRLRLSASTSLRARAADQLGSRTPASGKHRVRIYVGGIELLPLSPYWARVEQVLREADQLTTWKAVDAVTLTLKGESAEARYSGKKKRKTKKIACVRMASGPESPLLCREPEFGQGYFR
jgi:hypothetical protein